MDLYQLRIFSLAAKYESFSKVAAALFISPPSVSKYIASLESEIHHQLFVRDGRKIIMTDFGETFLLYVNEILEKEDSANRFLSSNKSDADIRYIGIISHMEVAPSDFYTEILSAKRNFELLHPDLDVKVRFHDYEDLRANLSAGNIDVALFSINNMEIPSSLPEGMLYKKLNHFHYSLAIPSKMAVGRTLEETVRQIKTLAFVNTPAPKRVSREFTTLYRIAPKLVPMEHWGQTLMKMASNECATFISDNLKETAALCGAQIYDLPDDRFSNGLYALWWPNPLKPYTDELAQCLEDSMMPVQ